jgi:Concanavalin A-like lectin/glucanases superfamily
MANYSVAATSVTSGLGVSIDASNCSSYSGTTITAADGTSYNGTLGLSSDNACSSHNGLALADYSSGGGVGADYVYLQNSGTPGDSANPRGDMTVETWVYINTLHPTNWNIIATRWFYGTTQDWHFGVYLGHLIVCLTAGNCTSSYYSSQSIPSGKWLQLAFTLVNPNTNYGTSPNANGLLTYYVNGVADANTFNTTAEAHTADGTNKLQLGDDRAAGNLGLDGYLGKFRLYNRALSAAEINQNFRADASTFGIAAAPYVTVNPAISGPATYNQNETSTTGTWLNTPMSYTYQWMRATTSYGTYSPIAGATSSTYLTVAADVGKYLEVMDTATNTSGSTAATSSPSPVIARAGSTLSFSASSQFPIYRTTNNLTINTNGATGYVNFMINGKSIPGCKKVISNSGNSYLAVCPWKPSLHSTINVAATFTSTDANYNSSQSALGPLTIKPRSTTR